ncbi:MAG: putative carboxyvinyl-carboxyphosphonate phosphorylmutase [Modestobacter sp.]|nr:putative carboxyvinyl-carboxyphosphonate phosphorylmutase [Modestobacter sp.]
MPDLAARARTLLALHAAPEILILANVRDVVSATVVAGTPGVRPLATASHSIAVTFGYVVRAVDVPVTMDVEGGYGDAGETARRAIAAGVVGGNLEDQLEPLDDAVVDALGPRKPTGLSVPGASLPARELQELGVARVSTGPFTQRVALTALRDATAAIVAGGTLPESALALN